jgi:hypothetical protein
MDAYVSLALDPSREEREHFLGMSQVFAEMVADGLGLKEYEVVRGEGEVSLLSKKIKFKLVQGLFDSVVCLGRKDEMCYGWRDLVDFGGFIKFLKRLD